MLHPPGTFHANRICIFNVSSSKHCLKNCPITSQDCTIDCLPGSSPPCSRASPLSFPETKVTKEYEKEALNLSYIHPQPLQPLLKRDGRVQTMLYIKVLICVNVKYRYTLLVYSANEQVRRAKIFTKLEQCSAYNLILIMSCDFQAFLHEVLHEFLNILLLSILSTSVATFVRYFRNYWRTPSMSDS